MRRRMGSSPIYRTTASARNGCYEHSFSYEVRYQHSYQKSSSFSSFFRCVQTHVQNSAFVRIAFYELSEKRQRPERSER